MAVHPMERDIGFDGGGGGGSKNIIGWGACPHGPHPHPGSEELKKCPPPSTAVQRIADAVRERKPR